MKLRDLTYNPLLRTTYEMPGGDYFSVNWGKKYWTFNVKIPYKNIIGLIEWLDVHAGLEWDFYDMFVGKIANGGGWVQAHNNRRVQLENVCKLYSDDLTTVICIEIANQRAAMLLKLTFDADIVKYV